MLRDKNLIKNSTYCEGNVVIPTDWNNGLQDILELDPVMILIIFFCSSNNLFSVELLQNIIPYFIINWKWAK